MSVRNGVLLVVVIVAVTVGVAAGLNSEGAALLAFKKAIWSDPQGVFRNWNSSDATPCHWRGVTCVADRVVSINVSRRALAGTIAPRLGQLRKLTEVSLEFNKLTGQLPKELFKASSNLTSLQLSQNELTGVIPADLGQQLLVLDLSGNNLTGALPQGITACIRLRRLVLGHNRIAGVIPVGIGALPLERLDLSVNQLSGSIPDDFGNLTSLLPQTPLNLSNNYLSGGIPPSLANLQRVVLDLRNNKLSGPVPSASYFQSQGPVAYTGNAALCGSPLKIGCSTSPSPLSSAEIAAADDLSATEPALSSAAAVAIAVGSGILGLMLMASLTLYCVMSISKLSGKSDQSARSCCRGAPGSDDEDDEDEEDDDGARLVQLSGVHTFNLEELLRAPAFVLGRNPAGIVCKAVLEAKSVVAVRRLGDGGEQKRKEFKSVVNFLAGITRHPNVVSLHSFSWTPKEKLLVFDYLPNGSLDTALHGRSEKVKWALTWDARVRIARGVAQGIAHIHDWKFIHGDIKPGNILLDVYLEPQVGDVGLQQLLSLMEPERPNIKDSIAARGDSGRSASSVSPAPELPGSWGLTCMSPQKAAVCVTATVGVMYQAPEATSRRRATQKSDVYSFGVVLVELLTGRSQFKQMAAGQLDVVAWLRAALLQKKSLCHIFDPTLLIDTDDECHSRMIESLQVALACIAPHPDSRPKMKQVAEFFEEIHANL